MPVIASSTAADWPASPMRARTRSGWRRASTPATCSEPASGVVSVASMRTNVDLPAPFGPRIANTPPVGAATVSPASASTLPKRLVSPSAATICAVMASNLSIW